MTISEILAAAHKRAADRGLPYQGALSPVEAEEVRALIPASTLIDVRNRAELDFVGRIPGSVEIEWQSYPDGQPNPYFLAHLEQQVSKEATVMFICRSGARSHAAATAASAAGYTQCYNVLEGFQGDKDANGHRDSIGGWRLAGLPWYQS